MDKVYCPWCGSEMELEHYGTDEDEYFVYVCPDCAAQSPISYSAESALATALARPLQKPLTLEEAKTQIAVWVERLPVLSGVRATIYPETYSSAYRSENNYGKTWRCWTTKPTDEEREAAKWE